MSLVPPPAPNPVLASAVLGSFSVLMAPIAEIVQVNPGQFSEYPVVLAGETWQSPEEVTVTPAPELLNADVVQPEIVTSAPTCKGSAASISNVARLEALAVARSIR